MFESLFNSFGMIPDLLRGKKPKDAIGDNLKNAALLTAGAYAAPAFTGGGLLGASGATNPALIESAAGTAGYGASSASQPGLLGSALGMMDKYGKPVSDGLSIASKAQQLSSQPQVQAPPMTPMQTSDPIGQMLQQQAQIQQMRRKNRYGTA